MHKDKSKMSPAKKTKPINSGNWKLKRHFLKGNRINPIRSRGGAILPPRLLAGSPAKTRSASHLNLSDFA